MLHAFILMAHFMTDAISPLLQCAASHTHSLCLSTILLSSPQSLFDVKPQSDLSNLSLITIKSSDKHRCFT
jgi:hypothetical protein